MNKPKNADFYGWDAFVKWGKSWGISFEYKEDWELWWNCWKQGYSAGVNYKS